MRDRIAYDVPKEWRPLVRAIAQAKGQTTTELLHLAVEQFCKKHLVKQENI